MNGTNRNSPRHGDRPSLDTLNKTIEGLEARIEGLMSSGGRNERRGSDESYGDEVSGILQRQRTLEQNKTTGRSLADDVRARFGQTSTSDRPRAPGSRDTGDIASQLIGLRDELKRDINDGMSREMAALRAEIRDIRAGTSDQDIAYGIREDMERLAASIEALGHQASPSDAANLKVEFDELRAMIDGLARQDTIRGFEAKLDRFNPESLEGEILSLAGRIDDIKSQLGGMNSAPAIRALEEKLFTIAEAVEMFGKHMPSDQHTISNQFSDIDQRLEDISRALEAGQRNTAAQMDSRHIEALEDRIVSLGEQIEAMTSPRKEDELTRRIEHLAAKIENMAVSQPANHLEERLEQLSAMLERAQAASVQPDLSPVLSDISRKIDALESGAVNNDLAQRLDALARRIEEIEVQPIQVSGDDAVFNRLESRLNDIAVHLNETTAQPVTDTVSLRNLEEQIANLSSLLSSSPAQTHTSDAALESRMASLEDYMAASDEYIVEAARQAAEAVVEAYAQKGFQQSGGDAPGAEQISALAADLRTLEGLTRSSEERNQRTFEALHDTLVQIAERIDQIGSASSQPVQMPVETKAPAAASVAMPRAEQLRVEPVAETPVYDDREETMAADETLIDVNLIDDLADEPPAETPEKRGLLSGLGRKFKPGRKEQAEKSDRELIDPSPSIDAADDISPDIANQLLEPGSGAPDIQKILEKVRASHGVDDADEHDKADYIAAARRAAKAAAQQMEAEKPSETKGRIKGKDTRKNSDAKGASTSTSSKYRRPIMLAAGAALLAISSYQLIGPLLGGSSNQQQAAIEKKTAAPAVAEATAPVTAETVKPVSQDAAPAAAMVKSPTAPAPVEIGNSDNNPMAVADDSAPVRDVTMASGDEPVAPEMTLQVPEGITPASLVDAANNNDPLAIYEIGARLAEGRGVPSDMAKAKDWFEQAATLGFAPAEYRLGNMYEKGVGVTRDLNKASEYYMKAAEAGNTSAMHNLAVVYATGINGTPDYEASAKWFTEAANHGVQDSQFNLAILYAKGSGVPQDLTESYKWFDIAARAGDTDAAQKRDEIAKALTPDQLSAAKAKSSAWTKQPVADDANSVVLPDEWAGEGKKTSSVDMKRAIRNIQAILNNNGFDAGTPDGIMGDKTVTAIKAFQKSIGQEPTGEITEALVRELLARNQ